MIFRENMVIVIQPNLMTYDEKMGLQFGETLVVKKNGCESLTPIRDNGLSARVDS